MIAEETHWIGRHDYKIIDEDHIVIYSIPRNPKKFYAKKNEVEVPGQRPASRKGNGYRQD